MTEEDLRRKLDSVRDLQVAQTTPIRVAHRRTGMVREKVIHSMSSRWVSDRIFLLDLDTSAGTYIKEFVHGDLGRTSPNVGSLLGKPVDILQLDVRFTTIFYLLSVTLTQKCLRKVVGIEYAR